MKEDGCLGVSPLTMTNLALRGTQLKNTSALVGCAVFTGPDTKMSLNSKITSNKFSSVERTMNICFLVYLLLLILEVIFCTSLEYTFGIDIQMESDNRS